MEHPLEKELKYFIVTTKASRLGDFTNEYESHPLISHIHIIGCKLLAIDPSPFNQFFKTTRDANLISELIEQYGVYTELAPLFIPRTVMAASVYKKMDLIPQAQALVNELMDADTKSYCEEIFNFKDYFFNGEIGLTVKNFNATVTDPISWLENKILTRETSPSSDDSACVRFNDFYFYKLNNFSKINREQEDEFFRIIDAPKANKKFKTKKNNSTSPIFLIGHLQIDGVLFNIHLSSAKNLFQGLPSTNIVLPDDFGKFLKDVIKDGAGEQITDKIKDYIVSYFPGVKEAKLIADLGEVVIKNTLKNNPNSLAATIEKHFDAINTTDVSIEDYYINTYLVEEFQKFFNQKDFPISANHFKPVFQSLYEYYILNVKGFLDGDYALEAEQLVNSSPSKHADTIRFKMVYSALKNPESKIKRKLFDRKSIS